MSVVLEITLVRLTLGCVAIALLPLFVTASAPKGGGQTLKISGDGSARGYTPLTYDEKVDASPFVDRQLPEEMDADGGGDGSNNDGGEFKLGKDGLGFTDVDYSTTWDADDAGGGEDNSNEATTDYDDSNEENNAVVRTTWVAQNHSNIHGCKVYTRKAAVYCDCSDRRLTSVPTDLPRNITMLVLYNNSIQSVPNNTFCNGSCLYCRLGALVLAGNKISRLELDSFRCLPRLSYLNLKHNDLRMKNGTFPTGVFKHISHLRKLKINRNNRSVKDRNLTYQDEAFGDLTRLKYLYVDGLAHSYFGKGFRRMRNLTHLTLSGYTEGFCRLGGLLSYTFENLPNLSFLNVSDCFIDGTRYEQGALKTLPNLKTLDLSFNLNIGFGGMKKILRDINGTKLTKLIANSIVTRFSTSATITQDLVENLPKTILYLEARENCFESVDPKVFDLLPENLTHLDLGSNRFVFGKYLENLPKLKNLETLKLTRGSFMYNIPRQYPFLPKGGFDVSSRDSGLEREPLEPTHSLDEVDEVGYMVNLILRLPPKLESIEMRVAGLDYILSELNVDTNNSLKNLSLAYNYFPKAKGPIYGLHSLISLDLRETSLYYIGQKFFKNFPSLVNLLLASCQLGNYFSTAKLNETIFHDLTNLEYLLLSDNRLTTLPKDVFRGLDKLRVLNLAVNQIWGFQMDISHMLQLRSINVSHTELPTLPKSVRDHVDMLLRRKNTSFTVDMSFTPIHCDCQNLEFLHWLVDSVAFNVGGFKNYMCLYPDTSHKQVTDGYVEDIRVLEKNCAENYPVFLAVLGGTLVLLGCVVAGLIYRFRWKIRYLYYAAYLKVKVKDRTGDKAGAFRYDVFISYAHNDEEFVLSELVPELNTRGLRLHVHGRDFVVGDYIASNIAAAVMECRKTLVVLTKNFLKSQWCNYEIQMANMESLDTGRQVLVFLFKEPISNEDLGVDLLYHIRRNTYTPYPQTEPQDKDEDIFKGFWDKLARDLNS